MERGDQFVWIKLDGSQLEGTILGKLQKLNGIWYIVCETKEGVIFMTELGTVRKKTLPPLKRESTQNGPETIDE
jgi:hypothetical protein